MLGPIRTEGNLVLRILSQIKDNRKKAKWTYEENESK